MNLCQERCTGGKGSELDGRRELGAGRVGLYGWKCVCWFQSISLLCASWQERLGKGKVGASVWVTESLQCFYLSRQSYQYTGLLHQHTDSV